MNKKEIYEKNRKKVKILTLLTPIIFWGLIVLAVIFFALALKNSVGNLDEITSLLNSKKFTGEELQANYNYLLNKYGEWVIGTGGSGFTITFINVKAAIFGGFSIFCWTFTVVCLAGAFILGKWLIPSIIKKSNEKNQDMVNLTILEQQEKEVE